jgi:hypothetical protein
MFADLDEDALENELAELEQVGGGQGGGGWLRRANEQSAAGAAGRRRGARAIAGIRFAHAHLLGLRLVSPPPPPPKTPPQEELDNQLLAPAPVPAGKAPVEALPNAPKTAAKPKQKTAEELELEALQAEMAL